MKKRIASLLLIALLLVAMLPTTAQAAANEITVYNWGQYISDGTDDCLDVIAAFEEETGIKVNYLTFDSNESMYTKLKTGGTTFDVIIPSDYMIAKLISEDMLEPLDFANIPNYEYIDEAFRNQAYDPENTYSVPYTWGTVGLIYNKNYVSDEDAESWSCLWNSKYQGKLLMFDNPRDAFAIAESMLGYSFNTEDEQEFKNCADLLATQSPVLQGYVMDQIFDRMERGEAWAAPYYAGDYLTMVEENPDLGFSHPKEGFNIFIDAMCIPKGCQNKAGAEAFINFLCRPDISAANLDYIGYSTPETAAKEYLDEEVIWDLKAQGAAINVWGVGTRMITSMDNPALGGVYKLSAEEVNGKFEPRIKISENPAKITNPGVKRLYRFYDRLSGKALADLIALEGEDFSSGEPLEIFDPENTWKKMTLCDYEVRPLLTPIFENGRLVYTLPTLAEISAYAKHEMDTFWDEYKRLHSPHRYKVDLSKPLYELKRGMLEERRGKV